MKNRILKNEVTGIIRGAIAEDLGGFGDITSKYLFPDDLDSSCHIVCKEAGGAILSGLDIALFVFEEIDAGIKMERLKNDGDSLRSTEKICNISGAASSILKAERTCLNFIQHMSGIATLTSRFVKIASPYNIKIVDTRKTKPLLRKIEKYAVLCGGGYNHRFGLFDGILIKDNHIAAAGGVSRAIESIREKIPHTLKIEVEVKNPEELDEAINSKADIIMLDNMGPEEIKAAVKSVREERGAGTKIEVSGNVTLQNLEAICTTGIDLISVGAITHSAPAIDFSLEFE